MNITEELRGAMRQRVLVLDGSMGVAIQRLGLPDQAWQSVRLRTPVAQRGNNDILCLTAPERISEIHRGYVEAGADIITTNTFNAQALSQHDYGAAHLVRDINLAGARLAREVADAANRRVWVAGSVGPTSVSLSLGQGDADFDTLARAYREQMEALKEGGVDLLIVETVFDGLNALAAAEAARGLGLPVIFSATLADASGRLLSGQTVEAFLATIAHADPLAVGFNCSGGPDTLRRPLEELAAVSPFPTVVYPNAGLPDELGLYHETPLSLAEALGEMAREGLVNIVGGCCGTFHEHISAIAEAVRELRPREAPDRTVAWLAGTESLDINDGEGEASRGFVNVGERCNVAGSRRFLRLVSQGLWEEAVQTAQAQVGDGAMMLDINLDDPMLDAPAAMSRFLRLLSQEPEAARVPWMIDSSDWRVIEAALKCVQGKPVVNSISLKNGPEEFLAHARACRDRGAAVVVMAFDEQGQATTFERKTQICARAYRLLTRQAGMDPRDIIFDPNILTIATGMPEHDAYALDYLRAVEWIKQNLPGARTSGGVSNLSFAFRGHDYLRQAMHAVFLYHAIRAGLDMAIVNPASSVAYEDIPQELRRALEDLIMARGCDPERLVELASGSKADAAKDTQTHAEELTLPEMLRTGRTQGLEQALDRAVSELGTPQAVISGPLMQGMERVGRLFGQGKMLLPQVVKSARTMSRAVEILTPLMESAPDAEGSKGTFLLATVKGDVHDIGKNIAAVVLRCNGWKVVDLGVMVAPDAIVEAALREKPGFIGLSGLITPSLGEMAATLRALHQAGVRCPVMVGGATTSHRHTLLRLAPCYPGGVVVRAADASQNPVLARKLMAGEEVGTVKEKAEGGHVDEAASEPREYPPITPYATPRPNELGVTTLAPVTVAQLRDYINWRYFLLAWRVPQGTPAAAELMADAKAMLDSWGGFTMNARVGFFKARSEGDDIVVGGERVATARGLSRFVSPRSDYVGAFAITTGPELRRVLGQTTDEYERLLAQTLSDRLAEAASEYVHRDVRIWRWGYAQREDLDLHSVLCQRYQGLRPAVGYPSIPRQDQIFALDRLLDLGAIGVSLTENGAMSPASSVCGLYIAHPEGKY